MTATRQQRHLQRKQRGYVLLVLLLMIAVLTIGLLELARYDLQYTKQQIQRDREEELIHRGVQYSRAVRRYFKKFGRYPARIEDLENTNNFRFLRKRYKDPITGKDFKLLRMNDAQFALKTQLAPNPVRAVVSDPQNSQAQSNGSETNQVPGVNTNAEDPQPDAAESDDQQQQAQTSSATSSGAEIHSAMESVKQVSADPPQIFDGGPIVGVTSLSKAKSIREFNKKDHYNQWQFVYDPGTDTGGLSMTPNQPPLRTSNSPNSSSSGN